MSIDTAYHYLFLGALIFLAVLIGVVLIRSVIGPRITDRILSINMLGTMCVCSIVILSRMLDEGYLLDVALIYAMISFVAVLILASVYIPLKDGRRDLTGGIFPSEEEREPADGKSGAHEKNRAAP